MNTNTPLRRFLVLLLVPLVLLAELLVLPVVLVRFAMRGHGAGCSRSGRAGSCTCFLSSWRAAGRGLRTGWRAGFRG